MRYCQECVDYAVGILRDNISHTEIGKILFINDNESPRITKIERNNYNINSYHYCTCDNLKIPAENVLFPYYIVIDTDLRINYVYFPNKETKKLDVDSVNIHMILNNIWINQLKLEN